MTRLSMAWIALLFSVCVWDFAAAGMLEMRCANVEEGKKVTIPSSAEKLQDACQLEVLVTPFKEGDLQFLFGISALTEFISREDIDSSAYKGVPKVFKLVNVTETFTAAEVGTARTLSVEDIPLGPVRSGVRGQCGNVYLLAALDNGAEMVDGTSAGAILQCPDETGVDLVAVLSSDMDGSQRTEYAPDGANVVLDPRADTIPIQIRIENRGSAALAARTDPDALKVWVYLGQRFAMNALNQSSPHRSLVPEMMAYKMHLPRAGDPMLTSGNLFPQDFPGSPEIPPGGSVTLNLTKLMLPDNICDAMLIIVNVDPIGEIRDSNISNNVVGYGINRECPAHISGHCSMYRSVGEPARAIVTLNQHGWQQSSSMIEYDALSGGISHLDVHTLAPAHRANVMRSVIMSHAVEAEVERLKSIGCSSQEAEDESEGWEDSMIARLGSSLAAIKQPLSAVTIESDWEEKEVGLMALIVETIGQLLLQPGSLRTIVSTVLNTPHHPFRPGAGGHTSGSGEHEPRPGAGGHTSGSGEHEPRPGGDGSGVWGDDNWPYTTTAYSFWDYGTWSYNSGDYNSGGYNSGGYSSGGYNSGGYNSGGYSSGGYSSGGYSSGGYSSGDYSSGGYSSGGYSSGDYSSGGYSSGGYSSGDYSSGGSSYSAGSGQYSESSDFSSYSPYSDYSGSESLSSLSGDYSFSSSSGSYYSDSASYDSGDDDTAFAEPLQVFKRRKRSHDTNYNNAGYDYYDGLGEGFPLLPYWPIGTAPSESAAGAINGMPGAMGGMHGRTCTGWKDCLSPMTRRVGRLVMGARRFMEEVGKQLTAGSYHHVRLPGQMNGHLTANFRRFLKELLWEGDFTQIPGYEMVDPEFVSNARRLVDEVSRMRRAEEEPVWFDNHNYPQNFTRQIDEWGQSQNVNPARPLPPALFESALRQLATAGSDFTFHDGEENQEMKSATVKLLVKIAKALLSTSREEVLDKFERVVRELHRVVATDGLPHGEPGEGPTMDTKLRRMVEDSLLKDDKDMGPMLCEHDGGIYAVERSPLTNDYLWNKVVACTCDPNPVPCQP